MDEWNVDDIVTDIGNIMAQHELAAEEYMEDLERRLRENPDDAVSTIAETYKMALKDAEGPVSGGSVYTSSPFEAVPRAMCNTVGAAYPYLDRDQKDEALGQILSVFDGMNYADVNGARGAGYTNGVRDPVLLADIAIARPLYWPGLDEGQHVVDQYEDFESLQSDIMTDRGTMNPEAVSSDFLVSYALLRSDLHDWGEDFAQAADSEFLDRTIRGIVATRFGLFAYEDINERKERPLRDDEIEAGRSRLQELLPESLHDQIDPLREEEFWVDASKF